MTADIIQLSPDAEVEFNRGHGAACALLDWCALNVEGNRAYREGWWEGIYLRYLQIQEAWGEEDGYAWASAHSKQIEDIENIVLCFMGEQGDLPEVLIEALGKKEFEIFRDRHDEYQEGWYEGVVRYSNTLVAA